MPSQPIDFEEALAILGAHAAQADAESAWPSASWQALADSGVLRSSIPTALGGEERSGRELLDAYEQLAGACLTSCFILSQRDAACRRLRDSGNARLRDELLSLLARNDCFATVGLSQLTTSRQHIPRSFAAKAIDDHFVLDGNIPWVTGAERADYVVIGATLDDGRQILAVLPSASEGVTVGPSLDLMALQGSLTAELRCTEVLLNRKWLLAGPVERVMAGARGGTGGLETSCLALGLAGAATAYLHNEAVARPELRPTAERLEQTRQGLRAEMHKLAATSYGPEAAAALRARANALVLRATQAALTASKGSGFLRQHPAQRWARQALFFLVWSCPRPAADATLAYLAPPEPFDCP